MLNVHLFASLYKQQVDEVHHLCKALVQLWLLPHADIIHVGLHGAARLGHC